MKRNRIYPKTILSCRPEFGNASQISQLKFIQKFEEEIQFEGFFKKCFEAGVSYYFVENIYDKQIFNLSQLAYRVHQSFDLIERILFYEYDQDFIKSLKKKIYELSIW